MVKRRSCHFVIGSILSGLLAAGCGERLQRTPVDMVVAAVTGRINADDWDIGEGGSLWLRSAPGCRTATIATLWASAVTVRAVVAHVGGFGGLQLAIRPGDPHPITWMVRDAALVRCRRLL